MASNLKARYRSRAALQSCMGLPTACERETAGQCVDFYSNIQMSSLKWPSRMGKLIPKSRSELSRSRQAPPTHPGQVLDVTEERIFNFTPSF